MLKIVMENYGVSRKKCLSPVDPNVGDLGTFSMSSFNSTNAGTLDENFEFRAQ